LIPWLKYINSKELGILIFYDERLPYSIVKKRISKVAYWLTEEERKRVQIGQIFEDYSEKFLTCWTAGTNGN